MTLKRLQETTEFLRAFGCQVRTPWSAALGASTKTSSRWPLTLPVGPTLPVTSPEEKLEGESPGEGSRLPPSPRSSAAPLAGAPVEATREAPSRLSRFATLALPCFCGGIFGQWGKKARGVTCVPGKALVLIR